MSAVAQGTPEPISELDPGQPSDASATTLGEDMPVPGRIAVGTTYEPNGLRALSSGRLHTKMFVHPEGLQPDGALPLVYTTATARVQRGLELLAAYRQPLSGASVAQLALFAWPCLPDYPCPDGDISSGWQWWIDLVELPCNITHTVDQGGHAQKVLYYANHTDRLDEGTPPLWKSAAYLWNYCDGAWDLAFEHTYREDKLDCSIPGAGCAWWGPGLEIFGTDLYPQIAEIGYEDSLLYHDGLWSELRPPEAAFRDPVIWSVTTPWQLLHLEPNRSYGTGNWVEINDPPVIASQQPLVMLEDEALTVDAESLSVYDPDVDPKYHVSYDITLQDGPNYISSDLEVSPLANFAGWLTVPITVSDGAADSPVFELKIEITPVNDAPAILGQNQLTTGERSPLTIDAEDVVIEDPDNAVADFTILVLDGAGYQRQGNTITPNAGVLGDLLVNIVASDGTLQSGVFLLAVHVTRDVTKPTLILQGSPTISIFVGDAYIDAGATATDDLDGDITSRIATANPVNTAQAGTYSVTYTVADLAGNMATAIRTVVVSRRPSSGGGGGSLDPLSCAALLMGLVATLVTARRRHDIAAARRASSRRRPRAILDAPKGAVKTPGEAPGPHPQARAAQLRAGGVALEVEIEDSSASAVAADAVASVWFSRPSRRPLAEHAYDTHETDDLDAGLGRARQPVLPARAGTERASGAHGDVALVTGPALRG